MSRLNSRYQTHIQRLGFNDPDLKTELHDRITFWARDNILAIAKEVWPTKTLTEAEAEAKRAMVPTMAAHRLAEVEFEIRELRQKMDQLSGGHYSLVELKRRVGDLEAEIPTLRKPEIPGALPVGEYTTLACVSEFVLANGRSEIGFLDVFAKVQVPASIGMSGGAGGEPRRWSPPIWRVSYVEVPIGVEAKGAIASFGELMRQLNLYRRYFNGVMVVVSPDDRFADRLRAEGIRFLKYEAEPAPARQPQLL